MLDDRDLQILRVLVDVYVREGIPVSSLAVKEAGGIPVSTATIRSSMARLEREGFLAKRHTSAGRIPTDQGYRLYVDHLETDLRFGGEFGGRFRSELRDQEPDAGTIMACASRALGGLSRDMAVVYGSVVKESRVNRVQLVNLEGNRLLVVLNLLPEYEHTVVLRMEKQFAPNTLERSEEWVNRLVTGRTPREAKEALDAAVRDNVTDEGIVAREVAVHREEIFSEPPALELYFEEPGHLMQNPEDADPGLLGLLLLFNNREYLARILSTRLGERVQVTIGREHQSQELRPFSLVTSGYRMGSSQGVLGIIGPTRMRYDLNRALIGSAARELGAIGEEYF